MGLQYLPEFYKAVGAQLASSAEVEETPLHDVKAKRALVEALMVPLFDSIPHQPDVEITIYHATSADGYSVPLYHYRKKDTTAQSLQPAVLHTHGGGHIAHSAAQYVPVVANMVAATGVQMFSADYRLAPEHPFTSQVEDCYAGLEWLYSHVQQFNIDPQRIAVFGESAGGGLAAGLAIMARDRNLSPPLAKQVLLYPMLDDRTLKPTTFEHLLIWTAQDNIMAWTAYVGETAGKEGTSPYAAPARVESVEGLPPTYMDVGTLDLFRDENIEYASRLLAANIEVEFHLYPGVPHAFDYMAPGIELVARATANRIKALTSF